MSSGSSKPTETRIRFSPIPAASRSAAVKRRALAVAACITRVATSPRPGAAELKGEHAAKSAIEHLARDRVRWMAGQRRVKHPLDGGRLQKSPRDALGVLAMGLHPHRQGAKPPQGDPGLEGSENGASQDPRVLQRLDPLPS